MSNNTYSREFLRGYQEMKRRENEERRTAEVDNAINYASKLILQEAEVGKTEWTLDLNNPSPVISNRALVKSSKPMQQELRHLLMSGFSDDEIVGGFRRKFSDCDIIVNQDWAETRPGTRELQTRITVSWK